MRSSRVIWVARKLDHFPNKGPPRQTHGEKKGRPCVAGSRPWSYGPRSHGAPGAPKAGRGRKASPAECPEKAWPSQHLGFRVQTSRTMNQYLGFSFTQVTEICQSSCLVAPSQAQRGHAVAHFTGGKSETQDTCVSSRPPHHHPPPRRSSATGAGARPAAGAHPTRLLALPGLSRPAPRKPPAHGPGRVSFKADPAALPRHTDSEALSRGPGNLPVSKLPGE